MSFQDHFYLGTIVRLYGFKGEVYAKLDVDYPEEYLEMESVFIELDNKLVPFFIEDAQFGSKGMLRIKFEDVDSEKSAKSLLKKPLYLPASILEDSKKVEYYFHEIIGFDVNDQNEGHLGKVIEVLEYPGNPIMKIEKNEIEVLVPLQDAFVVSVIKKDQLINVNLPEGMLDLND